MLKKLHPAKMLPVGILHPLGQHDIVTKIIPILQIVQRHHQSRAHPGRPGARVVRLPQLLVEHGPVHLPSHLH